jgi:membrane-associated HD superfamily phosphohydrolase
MIATETRMETANTETMNVPEELRRRHQSTSTTVLSLLVAVVLLCVLAFVSQKFLTQRSNPSLHMAVLITMLILGLCAVAFRRTKFATMRLQDIAALQGPSGLLITLQRTTIQVAMIGVAVAAVGFAATLFLGDPSYTYRSGVVAAAVLLYGYPVRSSWEQAVRRYASEAEGETSENPV